MLTNKKNIFEYEIVPIEYKQRNGSTKLIEEDEEPNKAKIGKNT